ncbi:MAG: class I SAM-dependent methyltransferase [Halobacteriaceae archaeon]
MPDPYSQVLYDIHFNEQQAPLYYLNGEEREEVDVEWYFDVVGSEGDETGEIESWVDGPLLDLGAGVGRHTLYYQEKFQTVAIENREPLVEVMEDRGVDDARVADMFALRDIFERDRFQSALAVGTQVSLVGSMGGLRQFLCDLAYVTTPDATVVFDGFDPEHERNKEKIDYHEDPTPGLGYRVLQMEYNGILGEPWMYRLFSPEKMREAVIGTGWEIAKIESGDDGWGHLYNVFLEKQ